MSAKNSTPGLSDQLYTDYVQYLTNETIPKEVSSTVANFTRDAKKYEVKNGVLIRQKKLVLKQSELGKVWKSHHIDLLHPGKFFFKRNLPNATLEQKVFLPLNFQKKLKTSFFWKNVFSFEEKTFQSRGTKFLNNKLLSLRFSF